MSIPRVFHGLDRKVFLSPKRLRIITHFEWHICAGKCRKYAKKCRKYAKKFQKQSKLILKQPTTRPRQRKMEKSLLGRILPKLPI